MKNNQMVFNDWTERRGNLRTLLSLRLTLHPSSIVYALKILDLPGASSLAAATLVIATLLNDKGDNPANKLFAGPHHNVSCCFWQLCYIE